jgi:hypothetical protein
LASGDAVASAREHVGAGGGNGGFVFSARRESEEGGRNESSSRAHGVLRTLRPVALPCGRSATTELKRLNSTESRFAMTH